MRYIIIDDEKSARAIITQIALNHPELTLVEEFSDALNAIKFLNNNQIDFVFLDIHMPYFTGFDFIQTIKNSPKIILVTSDKNFAIEAYEYESIIDYLIKPITAERFDKTLQKLKSSIDINKKLPNFTENKLATQTSNELYVNINRRLINIEFSSIILVEAKGDYILIKTETKNYTVHSTLKKIQDKLPSNLFLKIHRSFIINTKKIIDIENNSVLIFKDIIPVSRVNRPELMKRLNQL